MSSRATVVRTAPDRWEKRFVDPVAYRDEVAGYHIAGWAAPRLLDWDDNTLTLVIEHCAQAENLPHWKFKDALAELLQQLHNTGVNHRDLHVGNIVRSKHGQPLLIDWEHHTTDVGPVSYDLYGPQASGVPQPGNQRGNPNWWAADNHKTVARWPEP